MTRRQGTAVGAVGGTSNPSWPFDVLHEACAEGVSGDLAFQGVDEEVRVYLHQGRIAWAAGSRRAAPFIRHLVLSERIDAARLQATLRQSRAESRRFGEALVRAGVASFEQVLAASRTQVQKSLDCLHSMVEPTHIFVARNFDYDHALTFGLDELVVDCSNVARSTLSEIEGARYVAAVHDEMGVMAIEAGGPYLAEDAHERARLVQLVQAGSEVGGHSLTVRCSSGSVMGRFCATQGAWLMASLDRDVPLGGAALVLDHYTSRFPAPASQADLLSGSWARIETSHQVEPSAAWVARIDSAIACTSELLAVLWFRNDGECWARYRASIDFESTQEALWRASRLMPDARSTPQHELNDVRVFVAGDRSVCVGARVGDGLLWLVLLRSVTEGFGWSLLEVLAPGAR